MYENAFPIPNRGIGAFSSCFDANTKKDLYIFNYELTGILSNINDDLAKSPSDTNLISLKTQISDFMRNIMDKLINCGHVYDNIELYEKKICGEALSSSYAVVTTYMWLCLFVLLFAYSINRMKPLVDKKKFEIEVNYFLK